MKKRIPEKKPLNVPLPGVVGVRYLVPQLHELARRLANEGRQKDADDVSHAIAILVSR